MRDSIDFIEAFNNGSRHSVETYMKTSIKEEYVELEVVYGDLETKKKLTKQQFLDLKHHLTNSSAYVNLGDSDTLDIKTEYKKRHKSFPSSMRLSIEGLSQIKSYCKQDLLDPLTYTLINKLRYKADKKDTQDKDMFYDSIISTEYPCRVNLKNEFPVEDNSPERAVFIKDWSKKNKSFRYKKRYSFMTPNNIWRIDLTAVKQTKSGEYFKTFKSSNVLGQVELFELEIEYIGNDDLKNQFNLPPIIKYAELVNEVNSPNFDWESSLGNPSNALDEITLFPETEDLYLEPSSPRYDQGIEFDEPVDSPTPRYKLPDTITIKRDFWKDSDQEMIWDKIKDTQSNSYKFIPRNRVFQGDKAYIETEISPHLELETGVVSLFTIPVEYILEDVSDSWEDTVYESSVAESPRSSSGYSPPSPVGGGKAGRKISRGGNLFSVINSSTYSSTVISTLLQDLNGILNECFKVIHGSENFLSKSDETMIINEYIKLTQQDKRKWYFVGPQPVSMGTEHLNPYNPNSILSGYAVTEKADGIRAELLIVEGKGYLITPKKQIISTGVTFDTNYTWIFDGEYITQNKRGESIQLYMIFDVYYCNQSPTNPHTLPWYVKSGDSRSSIINEFKQSVAIELSENSMRIDFKQYYEGPLKLTEKNGEFKNLTAMLKYAKKILDKETVGGYEYFTDGLIFLPIDLPVKGKVVGESVTSIKGTWPLNYKWKPPEENTIDFKVIYMKDKGRNITHTYTKESEDGRKSIERYQKVQLIVGYKETDDSGIDYNWYQMTNKPPNKSNYQQFNPPENKVENIHITNIPLLNDKMICEKDHKSIDNGQIVEMRYDANSTNGCHWVPLRIRDDKVTPQYFTIANNIWNTINDPVTPEMIKGVVDFSQMEKALPSEQYYVDTYQSEDTPIRHLHNYIKSKLISRIGSSPDQSGSLMIADLSCGRGGDIKKYLSLKNKVSFLLGLDISTSVNEAAQRYYTMRGSKPPALFLQFDTSKSIVNKEGCLNNTEQCETMLDMIKDKTKSYPKKYKDIQKIYGGIARNGFDIVSSQFSVHYYFKNESTLRGFCENVRDLCSSGGYFIGTCYDGMKLFDLFESLKQDMIEMKSDTGNLIYRIKKLYTTPVFEYDSKNSDSMYGHEIEVFMSSIGQPIVEYLVNFDFFVSIMSEYGFEVAELPKASKEYNLIKTPIQSFDSFIDNSTDIQSNDSEFVNKTRNTELYKVKKIPGYKQLSSLNNTFVFQKK